jgi:hypothetical protein
MPKRHLRCLEDTPRQAAMAAAVAAAVRDVEASDRDCRVLLLGAGAGALALAALEAGARHVTCVERCAPCKATRSHSCACMQQKAMSKAMAAVCVEASNRNSDCDARRMLLLVPAALGPGARHVTRVERCAHSIEMAWPGCGWFGHGPECFAVPAAHLPPQVAAPGRRVGMLGLAVVVRPGWLCCSYTAWLGCGSALHARPDARLAHLCWHTWLYLVQTVAPLGLAWLG